VKPRTLIHPVAALLLMVIDALWSLADWAALAWGVTIPLSFFVVAVPTFFVQKSLNRDTGGRALAVAGLLGALAAVPTPVMGTVIGAIALALAGLRSFPWKR
jgi:hypothetical protein